MSITKTLGNAFSGLTASSRAAEIVSRNVANATTEGYTAKALSLSAAIVGGEGAGVRVDGVDRASEPLVTAARRRAEGAASNGGAKADVLRRLSDLLLDPGGEDSLSNRFGALESALRTLADTPESASVQNAAAEAGGAVARKMNALTTEATRIRTEVDREIQRQVDQLNRALHRIEALNREIAATVAQGRDATGLEDERDRMIDTVNGIVPIRASPRDNGGTMVQTANGALLVEGSAIPVSLDSDGDLIWAGIDATPPASEAFRGGSLEALFTARDATLPAFTGQLDQIARDLVVRFQNLPGYDKDDGGSPATLYTGLFTDAGAQFDETDTAAAGLAGRIALNAAVDPRQGGDPARMRTGLWTGALAAQPGADTFPTAIYDAMIASRPSTLSGITGSRTALALVSEFQSLTETQAETAESDAAFLLGSATAIRAEEKAATAVDTDAELKNLLAIEKAYAANARVLQTADEMLGLLLEI